MARRRAENCRAYGRAAGPSTMKSLSRLTITSAFERSYATKAFFPAILRAALAFAGFTHGSCTYHFAVGH